MDYDMIDYDATLRKFFDEVLVYLEKVYPKAESRF